MNNRNQVDHPDDDLTVVVRAYLDTQYTNLQVPSLISLGLLVAGRTHYLELVDGWSDAECSEFVRAEVLPHLGRHGTEQGTRAGAAETLLAWFRDAFSAAIMKRTGSPKIPASFRPVLEIVALHSLDFELMAALPDFQEFAHALPFRIRFVSVAKLPVSEVAVSQVFEGINRFFETDSGSLPRHHSLNGALALGYGVRLAQLHQNGELAVA